MRIWQYFRRKKLNAFRLYTGGVTGLRMSIVAHFFDTPVPRYKGPFPRHFLILMQEGAAAFRRDGETSLVEAGDMLLVQAGTGSLEFISSKTTRGFRAHIVEFDVRSVAKHLRQSFWAERETLKGLPFPKTGVVFQGVQLRCFPVIPGTENRQFDAEETFHTLFNYYSHRTAPFARSIFYEERWQVLRFLEAQVWKPLSDMTWMEQYELGSKRLAKDCLFFVGCTPEAFMKRRKIELASAWLRCGHRVNEIARVLGFSSPWEFQSLYGAVTKRRCSDVQAETPLRSVRPYELHEAISPFWWRCTRPTSGDLPTEFERDLARQLNERVRESRLSEVRLIDRLVNRRGILPEEPVEQAAPEPNRNIPAKEPDGKYPQNSAAEIRLISEEFFEMKTTAVEIVVPFLRDSPVRQPLAA